MFLFSYSNPVCFDAPCIVALAIAASYESVIVDQGRLSIELFGNMIISLHKTLISLGLKESRERPAVHRRDLITIKTSPSLAIWKKESLRGLLNLTSVHELPAGLVQRAFAGKGDSPLVVSEGQIHQIGFATRSSPVIAFGLMDFWMKGQPQHGDLDS
jgi:hypothetical protein